MVGKDKKILSVYIDPKTVEMMEEISKRAGVSKSVLVEQAWGLYVIACGFASARLKTVDKPDGEA